MKHQKSIKKVCNKAIKRLIKHLLLKYGNIKGSAEAIFLGNIGEKLQ